MSNIHAVDLQTGMTPFRTVTGKCQVEGGPTFSSVRKVCGCHTLFSNWKWAASTILHLSALYVDDWRRPINQTLFLSSRLEQVPHNVFENLYRSGVQFDLALVEADASDGKEALQVKQKRRQVVARALPLLMI